MSTLTSKMQPYINISSFDDVNVIKRPPDVSYRRIDCRLSGDVREATLWLLNAFFFFVINVVLSLSQQYCSPTKKSDFPDYTCNLKVTLVTWL